jgi:AAA domain
MNAQPAHLRVVGTDGKTTKAAPQLRGTWTADQLMNAEFPEPCWAVPGLIAEGVTLLAGPPKVGKSWLSLGLGLSVAAGGRALDMIPVQAGPVLYLALEDTARRLQRRMSIVLQGNPAPSNLTLATGCPPLTQGGDTAIAAWLDAHHKARLVVIDVFAKIRGNNAPGASAYEADYAAVTRVKRLADRYGVGIVLVHHVRKAGSDDFLAEVSGTNGIAGAADTTLVLKRSRGQADAVLHATGRDIDETEYALYFHANAGAWQLLEGPAEEHTLGDTRAAILRHVRQHGPATPKTIAEGTGLAPDNTKQTCRRMATDGQLTVSGDGRYGLPSVTAVTGVTGGHLTSGNEVDHG